jgi:LPS export ABC transporter protein LptC
VKIAKRIETLPPYLFARTTEALRVIPKESRAETDALVTVEEARGIIQGVGMVLDNTARTIRLKSAVRGTLQPNTPSR